MKWKPHEYQKRAVKFMVERACAGLFLDPGLGKTATTLAAFHLLKKQGLLEKGKMLVICPLRPMYLTWPAEVKKWEEFSGLKVGLLHGPAKGSVLFDDDIDIHVINPEGLKWLFAKGRVENPADFWDMLVVDESTRFKHADTERFKIIKPHLENFGRRYILTGSPAPNGLLDLFGQVYLLDLGNSLGRYITHYRATYFHQSYDGFNYEPNEGAAEKIKEKLAPLALRMEAKDYLSLPPLIGACGTGDPLIRKVQLPPLAKKIYETMENFMVSQLSDETVTAASAAAVFGKCRQIANGGLYGSGEEVRSQNEIHDAKTEAVCELLEELQGTPALVAYEYGHDLDRLLTRLGQNTPFIGGGVSQARFKQIEQKWNAGEIPVLLCQPQSVAHGLNLQGTKGNVIWHSLNPDLELYEQLIARVWRQGQKERVFVHHIVAEGTVDELIIKMLMRKDKTQRDLLVSLKEAYL